MDSVKDTADITRLHREGRSKEWNPHRAQELIDKLANAGYPGVYTEVFDGDDGPEFLLVLDIPTRVEEFANDESITLWIPEGQWQLDPGSNVLGPADAVHDGVLVAEFIKLVESWRASMWPAEDNGS
jgi:hypothetical protein